MTANHRIADEELNKFFDNEVDDEYSPTMRKDVAPGIGVRRLIPRNPEEDRTELAIIISESTTIEELKKAWAGISTERELLHQQVGSHVVRDDRVIILNELSQIRKKTSYATVAQDLNFDIILCVLCIMIGSKVSAQATLYGLVTLEGIIRYMNVEISEFSQWLKEAVDKLSKWELPWTPLDGPFNLYKVRNVLRQYQTDINNKKIILKETPTIRPSFELFKTCFENGILMIATDLLGKKDPMAFVGYSKRFDQRYVEVLHEKLKGVDLRQWALKNLPDLKFDKP